MNGPAKLDLDIHRRSDFAFGINLKDSNGTNENLSGKTILSQIFDQTRTNKVADVITTITDATGGSISWKVTHTQTALMTDNDYAYDVKKIHANGGREYVLTGTIFMKEGYTAE